ncbi:cytochrome c oxidase subunit II [Asticcacaulis taihuensis]|uniref:Cytochrome c oxidase subunit 2 n=2 Tax=Asticcacaulis taihuensis TaxID=260084 RepID=A0A1G4PYQ7_9CAUL|nr:cytochrome c oxidase subunit 2 [Asticcacaulis taihuensis]
MGSKRLFGKGLSGSGLFKAASGAVVTLALSASMSVSAFAEDVLGQPTDKAMGWQPAGSALKRQTEWFYNDLLFPIIVAICLLVAGLLLWIMVRYNKKANPVPAKFSHNTLIEIIWTVIPVLILVVIAIFSLSLLRDYNNMPKPDVVVKATGNQWFWTYDYPELGVTDIESRLREDAKDIKTAKAAGIPYLLEVDNVLVVPVNKVIHVQTTGADVIHSFTVPAFGFKIDAIPGRLNNTWFKAEKIGTYYGQCSELCGKDHAYMPIEVKVVSDADFDAFIIKNGGKTRAMIASEAAASAAAAEEAAASAATAASASAEAAASAAPASAAATPANASASAAPASGAAAAH